MRMAIVVCLTSAAGLMLIFTANFFAELQYADDADGPTVKLVLANLFFVLPLFLHAGIAFAARRNPVITRLLEVLAVLAGGMAFVLTASLAYQLLNGIVFQDEAAAERAFASGFLVSALGSWLGAPLYWLSVLGMMLVTLIARIADWLSAQAGARSKVIAQPVHVEPVDEPGLNNG